MVVQTKLKLDLFDTDETLKNRLNIPDSWWPMLKTTINSTWFKGIYEELLHLDNRKGVYLLNDCFAPFHLINPNDVRVVIFADTRIKHNTSKYPWNTIRDGVIVDSVRDSLYGSFHELEMLLEKKFKGSTFMKIYDKYTKNVVNSHAAALFERMKRKFNFHKINNDATLDTENWYNQGVLLFNPSMTGSLHDSPHYSKWRAVVTSLIRGIESVGNKVIFATPCPLYHDLINNIRSNDSIIIFESSMERFFPKINHHIAKAYGDTQIIDFLI